MTDKFGSSIVRGGALVTRTLSDMNVVSSGASGAIITIPAPTGQRVKLTFLDSATGENGVTLSIGGQDVLNSTLIVSGSTPTAGSFSIGASTSSTDSITGGVDEDIIVTKNAGNTTSNISYAYQFLE